MDAAEKAALAAKLDEYEATRPAKPPRPAKKKGHESPAAAKMRLRRQDPRIKEQEKKAVQARDAAYRRLATVHPADMLRMENHERVLRGLPPIARRGKRTQTTSRIENNRITANDVPTYEAPKVSKRPPLEKILPTPRKADKQGKIVKVEPPAPHECRHPVLKKLSYGNFCDPDQGGCGKRIR